MNKRAIHLDLPYLFHVDIERQPSHDCSGLKHRGSEPYSAAYHRAVRQALPE